MDNEQKINEKSDKQTQNAETVLTQNKSRSNTLKSILKEVFLFAVIAFGIVLPFRMFVAEPYIVSGASMDPTFKTGDYLIVDKLSYKLGEPQRNSVVVFKYPNDTTKNFIKRIIGLPGDTITVKGNEVKIVNKDNPNGFIVDQSYIVHTSPDNFEKTLGTGEYFAMGDNRAESFDSRSWGVLPRKDMLGRPILRLFPLNKIGILPGDDSKK
jgi:signal peptidase I